MRPPLTFAYSAHQHSAHAITCSQYGVRFGRLAYLAHLLLSQFRQWTFGPARLSSLAHHILRVVVARSKEKVGGIAASRYITSMKYEQTVSGSAPRLPCDMVGIDVMAVESVTVPIVGQGFHPNPATGFWNAFDAVFDVLLSSGKHWHPLTGELRPVSVVQARQGSRLFPVTSF